MEVWKNKKTGKTCNVTPWWEPIQVTFDEKFFKKLDPQVAKMVGKRKIAHGMLAQVGWLIENEHKVWIAVNLTAEKQFKKLKKIYENRV